MALYNSLAYVCISFRRLIILTGFETQMSNIAIASNQDTPAALHK